MGFPVVFERSQWTSASDFAAAAEREDALEGVDPDLENLGVSVHPPQFSASSDNADVVTLIPEIVGALVGVSFAVERSFTD